MAKYFKSSEIQGLSDELVTMLDIAREAAGIPFIINSGYRTKEKNAEVGGVSNSAHLKGLAVDIRAKNHAEKKRIFYGLGVAGFSRVLEYRNHIHTDIDTTKKAPVIRALLD